MSKGPSRGAPIAAMSLGLLLAGGALSVPAAESAPAPAAAPARVELRSADYLLVGLVKGDTMTVRVARALDNAPVTDAQVTAYLRGAAHAATAQVDGSYGFSSPDLALPGAAAIEFDVRRAQSDERLHGTLTTPEPAGKEQDANGVRQYAWWVLNFSVCIAAYVLFTRRRKADET